MIKRIFQTLILITFALQLSAQDARIIKLRPNKKLYKPHNYYITAIIDDRDGKNNIGTMRAGLTNKTVSINLDGGAAKAIETFINNSIEQNIQLDALEMHITQLQVSEKNVGTLQQADLTYGVAFYQNGNKLIEYTGSGYIQTGFDASAYIEKLIKNNIERSLRDFDNWYTKTEGDAGVQSTVRFSQSGDDKDLIYYNKNKKLQLSDFESEPDDMSKGAAATYSGISMKYSHERKGRTIKLDIMLYVYFDKSKSWCKEAGKSAKTLNHEQLHFDITALNACRLAEKIMSYNFNTENYTSELEALLKETDKEGAALQNKYDKETNHGIKQDIQKQWNDTIRDELNTVNCY